MQPMNTIGSHRDSSDLLTDVLEFVKQRRVEHAALVNDEHTAPLPVEPLPALQHLVTQLLCRAVSEPDAGEAVQCHAANVDRGLLLNRRQEEIENEDQLERGESNTM